MGPREIAVNKIMSLSSWNLHSCKLQIEKVWEARWVVVSFATAMNDSKVSVPYDRKKKSRPCCVSTEGDLLLKGMFIDLRERERERERNIYVREKLQSVASLTGLHQGSNLQPNYVPWSVIEPLTLWCMGWYPNHLSYPSRDGFYIFKWFQSKRIFCDTWKYMKLKFQCPYVKSYLNPEMLFTYCLQMLLCYYSKAKWWH